MERRQLVCTMAVRLTALQGYWMGLKVEALAKSNI